MTTPHRIHPPAPITYFIAFQAPGGIIGNREMVMSLPITGIKDIEIISDSIARASGFGQVVVTGWQRFETTGSATVCRCQHPDPEDI